MCTCAGQTRARLFTPIPPGPPPWHAPGRICRPSTTWWRGAGGRRIRCAEYGTFGTQALSERALDALGDRQACLLANHGVLALGAELDAAFKMAQLVEELARQYLLSQLAGAPVLLDDEEMDLNLEKFKDYGQQ